jgi:hypothetical protein
MDNETQLEEDVFYLATFGRVVCYRMKRESGAGEVISLEKIWTNELKGMGNFPVTVDYFDKHQLVIAYLWGHVVGLKASTGEI